MEFLFLIGVSFFTSMLTAIIGMGGGILLISVMPGFLPIPAIVPVHGMVQIASNASRTAFGLKHVKWQLVWPYGIGTIIGATIGSQFVIRFPMDFLPLLLGGFILLMVWVPKFTTHFRLPGNFVSLGALEAFLGLFVGAVGPLSSPFLLREKLPRDQLVVTHAVLATITHLLKVLTFGVLGFVFQPYLLLILGMIVSVTLGSYVGTRLRARVSESFFIKLFKVTVTLLAMRMIVKVFMEVP